MAATGFTSPLVHSPRGTQEGYKYRNGMGMVPCAEFVVYMDDFLLPFSSNNTTGWTGIIDTGGTAITHLTATVGANGVAALTSDNVSEGAALYGSKAFQLISGKKFLMECRLRTDDVTDNAIQFGLSDLTAVTNPEDLWTTTADNVIAFGILDGQATTRMLCDKANSGSTAEAGTLSLTANSWHTLALYYDGGTSVSGWVDGNLSQTWAATFASTVPTATALAPFVGLLIGNGAAPNTGLFDWVRVISER